MAFRLSTRRALLLAGTFGALALAFPAAAQQTPAPAAAPAAGAPAPLPPGSPLIGRPNTEGAMKLAPVAPPPIPASADKLADRSGQAEAAEGLQHRALCRQRAERALDARGRQGHRVRRHRLQDKVHYITDKDGKREVKVLVSGLHRPNGLAIKDGTLYIAELSKVSKIEKVEDNLTSAEDGRDLFRPAEG